MKKSYLFVAAFTLMLVCTVTFDVNAQQEMAELKTTLTTTHTNLKDYYSTVRNLIYVVCGVIGLAVLPGKYQKMQSGDPDAGKSMVNWGGSLVFTAVAAYLINLIFFA